jgi:hypothetical protein
MLTVMKASNKCIKGIITILKVKSNKELTNYINLVCLVLNWSMFLSSFMSINLKLTSETQIFNVVQKRGIAHLLFTTPPPRQFNRIHSNLHILFFFISH